MNNRLQLQTLLESLIGSRNVYFQPPESLKLKYPCIIYTRRSDEKTLYANNTPYQHYDVYNLTVVDKNPDSDLFDKVAYLPMCSCTRRYIANNLNHGVFRIYY